MCSHLNGKLILRLASGAELDTMHTWRSDDGVGCVMLLPNGTTLQRGTAVQNIVSRQALSINHYVDTSFQGCVEKSQRSQVRTSFMRSSPEKCKAWGQNGSKMVRDAALTAFVRATEERVQELFPTWDVRRQMQSNERRGDGVERAAVERAHRLAERRRTDRTRAPQWSSRARGD